MMKYVLLLVVVMILIGCANMPNLPPRDTIVVVEPTESGVVTNLVKYSYRSVRDGVPQGYQRYKTFCECFHQQAPGMRVNSATKQYKVTTEYLVMMDQRKLDAGQHSELVNQYHAVQIDNDRLGVSFKATGFWTASDTSDLAAAYQLAYPVVVSINDKTKTISSPGAAVTAPLFPFYVIYGCAVGPCV